MWDGECLALLGLIVYGRSPVQWTCLKYQVFKYIQFGILVIWLPTSILEFVCWRQISRMQHTCCMHVLYYTLVEKCRILSFFLYKSWGISVPSFTVIIKRLGSYHWVIVCFIEITDWCMFHRRTGRDVLLDNWNRTASKNERTVHQTM